MGRSTLDVISKFPDRFQVKALAAAKSVDVLVEQARKFRPEVVALADEMAAKQAAAKLGPLGIKVLSGPESIDQVAVFDGVDTVVAAIVGVAGLASTLAAVRAGRDVVLANKEALVAAGDIMMDAARQSGARILPADSEHNALFQCLQGRQRRSIRKVWLTASGGPFRGWTSEELETVTPEQALQHPSWEMGPKITIDSATLMNKGLEIIEAIHLFELSPDQVDVVVHPQSTVHGLVELIDGAFLAHLSEPDMRLPIAYCLSYPEPLELTNKPLPPYQLPWLTFEEPDRETFRCLRLAEEAARVGGSLPAVMNAANEVAVAAFLEGRIKFTEIAELVEYVMGRHRVVQPTTLEDVLALDQWGKSEAHKYLTAAKAR